MKGRRRLLITAAVTVGIFAALAVGVVMSGRSLVIIENRGETAVNLAVDSTSGGNFSWSGEVGAKQRVIRAARFTADGGVVAVCRNADGIHRTTGGYVTVGWPHRVDVVVESCGAMRIDAARIP